MPRGKALKEFLKNESTEDKIKRAEKIIANPRTPPGFKAYWRKELERLKGKR